MDNITDINQIKMAVLVKTAEYAFNGNLEEKKDGIPFELTNRLKPKFRCCVYREREIYRERIRLAMGKTPSTAHYEKVDKTQIVHVIASACEGCPIERFTVTSNCHNCIAQKCIKTCKFGAISKTPKGAYIDKTKCKKCGQCVSACPYSAIVDIERPCTKTCPVGAVEIDANDLAIIDEHKCINCGKCVLGCPFGAISDISMMTNVIDAIREDKVPVYAMIAPAIEGQFGTTSLPALKEAIKAVGFEDCIEVALGADIVAYREAEEVVENLKQDKKTTSSCCPAFVNLIKNFYPELTDNISTTVSPMMAAARMIKAKTPESVIVFIGPCVAKKNEALSQETKEVNYVLNFEELLAMFTVKGIELDKFEGVSEDATRYGKGFAKSGGVTNAVLKVLKEKDIDIELKACKCSGVDECKKALLLMGRGRLPEDFVEGMACENGCINGPSKNVDLIVAKKIFDKYADNSNENITETITSRGMQELDIHRH